MQAPGTSLRHLSCFREVHSAFTEETKRLDISRIKTSSRGIDRSSGATTVGSLSIGYVARARGSSSSWCPDASGRYFGLTDVLSVEGQSLEYPDQSSKAEGECMRLNVQSLHHP